MGRHYKWGLACFQGNLALLYKVAQYKTLKGRFKKWANKTYFFFYLEKKDRAGCGEAKRTETQTTPGTLKFNYTQTEFL